MHFTLFFLFNAYFFVNMIKTDTSGKGESITRVLFSMILSRIYTGMRYSKDDIE